MVRARHAVYFSGWHRHRHRRGAAGERERPAPAPTRRPFSPVPAALAFAAYREAVAPSAQFAKLRAIRVGAPELVRAQIEARAADCQADELMIVANIHGHANRLRSCELIAPAFATRPALRT
jgi:alkanesulfonate monooxygenase SsuD/methylene tetrahydromethanopterin reductase-like flavin-dependent oxidoreductase (luciferase family)